MLAEHLSTETDPYRRGGEFGERQAKAVRNTVRAYERLFAAVHGAAWTGLEAVGAEFSERLASSYPEALVEIRGIATGASVSPEALVAINARTEVFGRAGGPECSVIGVDGRRSAEGVVLAQNWDWHPDAADSLVVWTVVLPGERWFTTLTEAGMLAKVGLNGDGLGVCINRLRSSADGVAAARLPIHIALRLLLERCRDLDQAEELLRAAEFGASTAITVAVEKAGSEELRSFEAFPGGLNVLAAEDGTIAHTNHFLGPIGALEDVALGEWPDSVVRLAEIRERLDRCERVDAEAIKAALRSHEAGPTSVCCHLPPTSDYAEQGKTVASVVLHVGSGRLEVAAGSPCNTAYVDVQAAAAARDA